MVGVGGGQGCLSWREEERKEGFQMTQGARASWDGSGDEGKWDWVTVLYITKEKGIKTWETQLVEALLRFGQIQRI